MTLIYGIITIFILGGCAAASLAEMASAYPTAGGPYHWTSIIELKTWGHSLVSLAGFQTEKWRS